MIKVKNYKNGATLVYSKKKRKHTSVVAGFVFGRNRDKFPEPVAHFCEHMFLRKQKNGMKSNFVKICLTLLQRKMAEQISFTLK